MATYYLTEFILIATRCPEILDYFRDPGEGRKPIAIAMLLGVAWFIDASMYRDTFPAIRIARIIIFYNHNFFFFSIFFFVFIYI